MKRRGMTLVEVIVAGMVLAIIVGGLFSVFLTINGFNNTAVTMPQVQEAAQKMTLSVAADIRRAALATATDTGYTLNAAAESCSSTGLTVYKRSSGTMHKLGYSSQNGNVTLSIDGSAATDAYTNSSLTFTYYQSSSYHATSMAEYTPTSSTTPNLIAVKVAGTATINGMTATYTTVVRLRNSPLKVNPLD